MLNQKPSLVIGASTGLFGAVWAQAEVRKTLAASGAIVLDAELAVAAADGAFTADASLADPRLRTRLRALLGDLIAEVARRERSARQREQQRSGVPKVPGTHEAVTRGA